MIHIRALTNDFSGPGRLPALTYQVKRYSHSVRGGPKVAMIEATGPQSTLEELFNCLRTPIILDDELGDAVWWGFIAEVRLSIGPVVASRSIDGMRNSITIRYSTADGTSVGRTDSASDSDSIDAYGTRELVDSMPSASLEQAISYRDTLLALRKEPLLTWDPPAGGTGVSASITCRGWWSTTDWLYYQAPEAETSFEPASSAGVTSFGFKLNSNLIAFEGGNRRIYLFDSAANNQASGLGELTGGEQINVFNTGAPGPNHNKTFSVQSAQNTHVEVTRSDISFGSNPLNPAQGAIIAAANNFYDFQSGELIRVMGSASNDGYYKIVSRAADGSTLYLSTTVTTAAAGPSVTIRRGVYVRVSGVITDELPSVGVEHYVESRVNAAQSFVLDGGLSSLTVSQVRVKLRRSAAAPAQTITLSICADSSGSPGVAAGQADIASSAIGTTADWVTFTFSPAVVLSGATTYWLWLERDVPSSTERRGQVWLSLDPTGAYAGGALKINQTWSGGGSWQAVAGDAPFRMTGDVQTTEVAESILNGYGQFFSDVLVLDASGVISQQKRNGNQTARQEVENLLNQGTSDRKPLYASVDVNRVVRIYKEPTQPDVREMWRLHLDGTLATAAGAIIPASRCPVGCWVKLHNVFSSSFDIPGIVDPSIAFIEEAEYDVAANRWRPQSRGSDSPWALGGLRKG